MTKNIFIFGNDKVNWSVDEDRKNTESILRKTRGVRIVRNIFRADAIHFVWYSQLDNRIVIFFLKLLKMIRKVSVSAVITNDIRNFPDKITRLKYVVDTWVAPSHRVCDFLRSMDLNVEYLPFLVDKEIFYRINIEKNDICKKISIDPDAVKGKFLIGSFQRDSLGTNLNEAKWQKNPQLLVDICKNLPRDRFVLVLAGPRRHFIANSCRRLKIPFIFVGKYEFIRYGKDDLLENNLSLEKINLLYNLIDLYIITSKSEGGPKAVLEAALTKTAVFSTDVGLASDMLHPKLIFSDTEPEKIVKTIKEIIGKRVDLAEETEYNYETVNKLLNDHSVEDSFRLVFDLK